MLRRRLFPAAWILPEFGERATANNVPFPQRVMRLRAGQQKLTAGGNNLEPRGKPGLGGATEGERMKANRALVVAADAPRRSAAIAEVNGDDAVGMARHDPHRRSHVSPID